MQLKFKTSENNSFTVDVGTLATGCIAVGYNTGDSFTFNFDLTKAHRYATKAGADGELGEFIIPRAYNQIVHCSFTVSQYSKPDDTTPQVKVQLCQDIFMIDTLKGTYHGEGFVPPVMSGYLALPNLTTFWKCEGSYQAIDLATTPITAPIKGASGNDASNFIFDPRTGLFYANMLNSRYAGAQEFLQFQSQDLLNWVQVGLAVGMSKLGKNAEVLNANGGNADVVNLWSGSSFIDTKNILGFGYNRIYYFLSKPAGQTVRWFGTTVLATPNIVWCSAKTIYEDPDIGGVLYTNPLNLDAMRDGRMYFSTDGKIRFVVAGSEIVGFPKEYYNQSYYQFELYNLQASGIAQVSDTVRIMPLGKDAGQRLQMHEVPGPIVMKDAGDTDKDNPNGIDAVVFTYGAQNLNTKNDDDPSPAGWNSLLNYNLVNVSSRKQYLTQDCVNEQQSQLLDIGLDSYASCVSRIDPMDTASQVYWSATIFNWGYAGDIAKLPDFINFNGATSTPQYKMNLNKGKISLDFAGGIEISVQPYSGNARVITLNAPDGTELCRLDDKTVDNRIMLNYDAAKTDEFLWKNSQHNWDIIQPDGSKTSAYKMFTAKNYDVFPRWDDLDKIIVHSKAELHYTIILFKMKTMHDCLFTCCHKTLGVKVNGIDGVKILNPAMSNMRKDPELLPYYWQNNILNSATTK